MPVPEQTPVNSSVGNGVTTVFPYTFKIFDADDLFVEVDGIEVEQSAYSVSDVGVDGGGNVTFNSAPASGAVVVRYRDMAVERTGIDYQEGGGFEAATVDEDVDRTVMMEQERALAVKRALKAPRSVTTDLAIAEADWTGRAGKFIRVKNDGSGIELVDGETTSDSFQASGANTVARSMSSKVSDIPSIKDWGGIGNGSEEDTAALESALTDLSDGDMLFWPAGSYPLAAITTSKKIHHVAMGRGLRATSSSRPTVTWLLAENAAHLYKFSDLQTDPALVKHTLQFSGIALNGNGMTVSDALMVVEGIGHPRFDSGSISGGFTGAGLRLRLVWAPAFEDFTFYNFDASGANGALIIDERYDANNLLNVNYVSMKGLKMEGLLGTYIFAHELSNLDVLDIEGAQFEFGRSSVPSGGPWSLFKIRNGYRVNLHRGVFTNFKNSNKYPTLFEMGYANGGTDYACTFSIKNNFYSGVDASTVELATAGNARGECFDNYCFNSSNVVPVISSASKAAVRYTAPRNLDGGTPSFGSDTLDRNYPVMGRASASGSFFVSIHELYPAISTTVGPYFVSDAAAKNMQGASLESPASADVILAQLPMHMLAGIPAGVRIGVRCRSATGIGAVKFQAGTFNSATLTVPVSYRTLWFDISESCLRTLGDSGSDRLRLTTGSANAEKVYIDGVYILPLIGPSFEKVRDFDDFLGDVIADQWGSAVGTDPQCVAAGVLASVNGGYVRLTTGDDAAGTMAVNGSQLHRFLQWRADSLGLVCEFRVRISAITDVAVFVGLTDTLSLEMPFTLGGGDALTSNATDGCGVLFDTGADTDNWWLVGVDSDSDATKQNTALAPVAATFETWRIELSNAGVATFLRNGSPIGTTMTAATSPDVRLTPVIAAFSRAAASRNVDVDYVLVECDRV